MENLLQTDKWYAKYERHVNRGSVYVEKFSYAGFRDILELKHFHPTRSPNINNLFNCFFNFLKVD